MIKRNPHFYQLKTHYLFPEINQRKNQFLERFPNASLINLGIGDTTLPIPEWISLGMAEEAMKLATQTGYRGYSPESGSQELRALIAQKLYHNFIDKDSVFVSDGAKCDIGRLQVLFGNTISIALQNPTYPVYLDGSLIMGVKDIHFLACNESNGFFPDLEKTKRTDVIYFCSPNNPTGSAATFKELKALVDFAKHNGSLILFDSAYSSFIQDPSLPKSIYEIPGAKEVAIEIGSFSKMVGFTGVRLGWTVVPDELRYASGESIKADWKRLFSTLFNGASILAQKGGILSLSEKGMHNIRELNAYYLQNAQLLKNTLTQLGLTVFGGDNAPYLWVKFKKQSSWDTFQYLLENFHLITTPGSGFGSEGEGYIRLSAFSLRAHVLEAIDRLEKQATLLA